MTVPMPKALAQDQGVLGADRDDQAGAQREALGGGERGFEGHLEPGLVLAWRENRGAGG